MSHPIRRRRITAASPTPEKLATFLRHLEESGSVSLAAERTGVARNTVYLRRKVDPAFALGWHNAVELAPRRCATPPSPAPTMATTAC